MVVRVHDSPVIWSGLCSSHDSAQQPCALMTKEKALYDAWGLCDRLKMFPSQNFNVPRGRREHWEIQFDVLQVEDSQYFQLGYESV